MEQGYQIYGLREPNSKMFRYIGFTKSNLQKRLSSHLCDKTICHRTYWFNYLKRKNVRPVIELIEDKICASEIQNKEINYIKLFRSFGAKLVNGTNGGDGMRNPTEETRLKMSLSHIGKPSHRKGKKYNPHTCETKRKMSLAHTGKKRNWNKEFYSNMGTGKKKVSQYDLNGNFIAEWESTMSVQRALKIGNANISKVCLGKQRTAGGFIWKYG